MNAAITFVAYFNRAPQFITDDEIRFYLRYQSEIRRLKSGSMGIIHGMLKFLYAKTLRIERPVLDVFRCPKDTFYRKAKLRKPYNACETFVIAPH